MRLRHFAILVFSMPTLLGSAMAFADVDPPPPNPGGDLGQPKRVNCGNEKFLSDGSFAALPNEIRDAVKQSGALADYGEPFNATDVRLLGDDRPSRRFAFAAVGRNHSFVALEQGGIGYSVEIWSFQQSNGHWIGGPKWMAIEPPISLTEILFVACDGSPPPPPRPPKPKIKASGFIMPDGTIDLAVFERRPFVLYEFKPGDVGKVATIANRDLNKTLSSNERAALLIRLKHLQRSMHRNDPSRSLVDDFIHAAESVPPK